MAVDPNIIMGGNNRTGEETTAKSSIDNLLSITETDPQIKTIYNEKVYGAINKAGGEAVAIQGTDSLFNPFYVFRYAKYGSIQGNNYSPEYHRDTNDDAGFGNNILKIAAPKSPVNLISENKRFAENPSASQIVDWARSNADNNLSNTTLGAMPYQWNDFLWCKWYGKIPNNRMLTLRRYPIPIEDNLQVDKSKMPLIPIAQAVTWWGNETQNSLSSVLGIDYGFNWDNRTANVQDVTGNEVSASALLDAIGLDAKDNENLRKLLLATLFDNPDNPYDATGYDQTIQDWIKESYGSEGQYWNRILGPVNVIDSTQIRTRGFKYTHNVKLTFTYKLRSFNNINPRVAMLDLISNFLSLTHNKADFWGGGIRYFQKTGYILPGLPTRKFEEGDYVGGIRDVLTYIMGQTQNKAGDLKNLVQDLAKDVKGKEIGKAVEKLAKSQAVQNLAGSWVSGLMQKPLTARAFLDGRAVGEWHLTVGNPMNPIAVIGNLCLQNSTIAFSDSLGIDDFPTEVTFTTNLTHGRPRAKQDIESMFNLGGGSMFFTALPQPSTAYNSLGEKNSITANGFRQGSTAPDANSATDAKFNGAKSTSTVNDIGLEPDPNAPNRSPGDAANAARYFSVNVARAYGEKFSKSPALIDYFKDLKTKD